MTTTANAVDRNESRARAVSDRCGVPYVRRTGSLARILAGSRLAYVVAAHREHVTDGEQSLAVDAGLLHAKVASGEQHPLIRAVGPVRSVFDGTLGLAGDALHLSASTGAQVFASEASPVVFSLVEAALRSPPQAWADAASRIQPRLGPAHVHLQGLQVDCVFLAPMFVVPAKAAPGYGLFRAIADHRPLDRTTLEVARAAAPRVVVRVEKGAALPDASWERLAGKAVDYGVWVR